MVVGGLRLRLCPGRSRTAGAGWRRSLLALAACAALSLAAGARERRGTLLLLASGAAACALRGPGASASACAAGPPLARGLFGELDARQVGIGAGAALVLIALLALLAIGLALRGAFGGDAFVAGAVTPSAASILLFTAWPILRILLQAFQDGDGAFMPALLVERLAAEKIWSLAACAAAALRRGVEHAGPGACLRRRHDRARAGLRAARHAHRLRLKRRCAC